jgi:hypothetical protein
MSKKSEQDLIAESIETYLGEALRGHPEGTKVRVPHKGKMTSGKVVRYDQGYRHGSPFYVVDVGEYESIKVPEHKVEREKE